MHLAPYAFALPRAVRFGGRVTSLQKALLHGADPFKLEVEDGAGGWQPYLKPRSPARRDR